MAAVGEMMSQVAADNLVEGHNVDKGEAGGRGDSGGAGAAAARRRLKAVVRRTAPVILHCLRKKAKGKHVVRRVQVDIRLTLG